MVGAGALLIAYFAWIWWRTRVDPSVVFLSSHDGAEWIRHDEPFNLATRSAGTIEQGFRIGLRLKSAANDAVLEVRALKRFKVLVDGKVVTAPPTGALNWKIPQRIQLAPYLTEGDHQLTIVAQNENGPVAVWAHQPSLGIHSDTSWESTVDGIVWQRVRLATDRADVPLAREFESPLQSLAACAAMLGAVFAIVAGASYFFSQRPGALPRIRQAATLRWIVLGGWVVLGANNILKLPAPAGFDVGGHLDYIVFLLKNHRVPLATDGWQMFQSPLNYLVSVPLYHVLESVAEPATVVLLLRLLPLGCGFVQIELCYRASRRVFPGRNDLQMLGTLLGGLLPMNIYLSQYVGNEPLASVLSAATFVAALQLTFPAAKEDIRWTPVWLGLLFGLSLLTKISAVLMVAPIVVAIGYVSITHAPGLIGAVSRAGKIGVIVLGIAAAVAGWYYLRNLIHLGRPFVGGWDLERGIAWWQDPGYRTAADFWSFGTTFERPVYAGVVSFWDGVYATFWSDSYLSSATATVAAPRWDHRFIAAGVLLALIPTLAILAGIVAATRRAWRRAEAIWLVVLAGAGAYGIALLHHAITLPYYCAIKAFYMIGALPAFALLMTLGCASCARGPCERAILHGLFGCWCLSAYLGYFSRG